MAKIICDAVPFCYGPISKLLTVAELRRDGNDLTILADGTSMDMATRASFRVMRCDAKNTYDLRKVKNDVVNSAMYINVIIRCCTDPTHRRCRTANYLQTFSKSLMLLSS